MQFNQKLSPKLTLLYSETLNQNADWSIESVRFAFNFYGEIMFADVRQKDIDKDQNYITGEGAKELWDSFERIVPEDHWDEIKTAFQEHVNNENT